MDVRWIGATAALAAVLACGGCSKGPKRASAREAERPSAPAWRAEEPSPPAPPQFPGIGPDTSNPDLSAALRHLRTQAGRRADLVDGPWSHARPGQFVTYAGAGGIRLTHKVLAVEDDGVTVETSASTGGTRLDRHLGQQGVPDRCQAAAVPRRHLGQPPRVATEHPAGVAVRSGSGQAGPLGAGRRAGGHDGDARAGRAWGLTPARPGPRGLVIYIRGGNGYGLVHAGEAWGRARPAGKPDGTRRGHG